MADSLLDAATALSTARSPARPFAHGTIDRAFLRVATMLRRERRARGAIGIWDNYLTDKILHPTIAGPAAFLRGPCRDFAILDERSPILHLVKFLPNGFDLTQLHSSPAHSLLTEGICLGPFFLEVVHLDTLEAALFRGIGHNGGSLCQHLLLLLQPQ